MERTCNSTYSPCDFVMKARDNQPASLTLGLFSSLLSDMNVRFLTDKVREHGNDAQAYKLLLPAICWQAKFRGKLRTNANAIPTGLFCIDVDIHHEARFRELLAAGGRAAAIAWATAEAHERATRWTAMQEQEDCGNASHGELGIVAIHISPSGTGVHVVAVCHEDCRSIPENQQRLAHLLGTSYDEACSDWARIFFVAPRPDWYYIDYDTLFPEH